VNGFWCTRGKIASNRRDPRTPKTAPGLLTWCRSSCAPASLPRRRCLRRRISSAPLRGAPAPAIFPKPCDVPLELGGNYRAPGLVGKVDERAEREKKNQCAEGDVAHEFAPVNFSLHSWIFARTAAGVTSFSRSAIVLWFTGSLKSTRHSHRPSWIPTHPAPASS